MHKFSWFLPGGGDSAALFHTFCTPAADSGLSQSEFQSTMEGRHGPARRFRLHREAAGGHRPRGGRLRDAEEVWRAELDRTLPLSQGEDRFLLGPCVTAVLPLLWVS